jgi:hypothetical protein
MGVDACDGVDGRVDGRAAREWAGVGESGWEWVGMDGC